MKRVKRIDQFLPTITQGDAIGNEAQLLKKIFLNLGFKSEIFVENRDPTIKSKYYKRYLKYNSPENVLLYHYSIDSSVSDFYKDLSGIKILLYHNVTSPEFFADTNPDISKLLLDGREKLVNLVPYIDYAFADSEYNRLDLLKSGFNKTGVLPIIKDFLDLPAPNKAIIEKYSSDSTKNILFVGRITPNKKQEDIILSFAMYNKINPRVRLFLIGGYKGSETYYWYLLGLIKKLNLNNVVITGSVSPEDLVAYYSISDLFLCMSEHEGFCVPLLEAMYHKIPIVAYASTAIPYTLGNAGVLINEKEYSVIAGIIDIILKNDDTRDKLIKTQNERLDDFDYKKSIKILFNTINKLANTDIHSF
ncbi:glycosyltransferase [uncultured Methanospirillum sp.]|uniref:glycosyltransferase n=1 Tax=uncultured Methanospirillum sp. TaxID=262503 RepID=UPI0029C6B384|nr:glycosyltransferase [uncultured Methanospirillum sp.]